MTNNGGYLVPVKFERQLRRVVREQEQREAVLLAVKLGSYWAYWWRRLQPMVKSA
jgi:hypothetical protein